MGHTSPRWSGGGTRSLEPNRSTGSRESARPRQSLEEQGARDPLEGARGSTGPTFS